MSVQQSRMQVYFIDNEEYFPKRHYLNDPEGNFMQNNDERMIFFCKGVIETVKKLEDKLSHIKTPITLSIIGCVVNGPGEASQTEIGITGGGKDNHMLYLNGFEAEKVMTKDMINKIVTLVEEKASNL